MPYIKMLDRAKYIKELSKLSEVGISNPGELNYLITCLCNHYAHTKKVSYQTINDIIGVLECAKQEYYRRVVGPYEEIKIKENGDL